MAALTRQDQELITDHFDRIIRNFEMGNTREISTIEGALREIIALEKPNYFDDDMLTSLRDAKEKLEFMRNHGLSRHISAA